MTEQRRGNSPVHFPAALHRVAIILDQQDRVAIQQLQREQRTIFVPTHPSVWAGDDMDALAFAPFHRVIFAAVIGDNQY